LLIDQKDPEFAGSYYIDDEGGRPKQFAERQTIRAIKSSKQTKGTN
jgi:hypothetical protein